MPSAENVEKWKFWFAKFYIHFHWISRFHHQRSHFISHTLLSIILNKLNVQKMWWTLINCLFRMKRIESFFLKKTALWLYKRVPFLTKRHLGNTERQVEVEYPLIGNLFWHFQFKLRINFFFEKGTFQRSFPGCFIVLK